MGDRVRVSAWRSGLGVVLAIALLALSVSACGTSEVANEPAASDTSSDVTGGSGSSGETAAPAERAGIGDTLNLTSYEDTSLAVTVKGTKRVPALSQYGTEIHGPLYGVKIRIKNTGGTVYDDAVSNCTGLVSNKGEELQESFAPTGANGNLLAGTLEGVKISPGSYREGWTWFDVPKKTIPELFQFTPNSGMGETVGEWILR